MAPRASWGCRPGRVVCDWRGFMLPVLVWLTLLAGCSGLPPMPERTPSTRLPPSSVTAIGRAVQANNPGGGRSGVRALADPLDAFVARMLLVRSAEASLDIQYYIWRPDTTGLMLLDALRQAADRGVRVRLLLDDNGIAGLDGRLAALDAHDRVEVRLFNPYPFRTAKALGYVTDFERLNRRMHNKALVADTQAAIVGGRNIGDAYFGADPALDFADLDVLAAGPIADDVAAAFDDYWNSALAYPLAALVDAEPGAAPSSNDDNAAPDANGDRYRRALRDAPWRGTLPPAAWRWNGCRCAWWSTRRTRPQPHPSGGWRRTSPKPCARSASRWT